MDIKVFLNPNERNDATSYYIDLVVDAMRSVVDTIEYVDSVNDINKRDIVLVITLRSYIKILKHRLGQPVIFWFQGVEPEELQMNTTLRSLRQCIRIKYFELLEKLALSKAKMLFFVSEAMLQHYRTKYGYKKNNYLIVPCFNQELNSEAFNTPNKYESMSFVYAGGIQEWQCVLETLQIFKIIKFAYPNAQLTILTKQISEANDLIDQAGLNDVTVKYVPLANLSDELSHYKYGFLIRREHIVNNVATPTKFNSYLSLGIIPVITPAIRDFESRLRNLKYKVVINDFRDNDDIINQVAKIEDNCLNRDEILDEYTSLFDDYYNPSKYRIEIRKKFLQIFK